MSLLRNKNKSFKSTPYFSLNKRNKKKTKKLRLFIEGLIFSSIGTSLILFLNSLPARIDWNEYLKGTWSDLIQGIYQLLEAIIKIAGAISVVVLILLTIFLLFAGAFRLIRLFAISLKPKRKQKNIFKNSRNRSL